MTTKKIVITAMVFITALLVFGLYDVRLCATAHDTGAFFNARHLLRTLTTASLVVVMINDLFSTKKKEA
jgi:hypothetical protein